MIARLTFALLALGLTPTYATQAQEAQAPARLHAILAAASPRAVFRLRSFAGAQAQGSLVRLDSASVTLRAEPLVPLSEVASVWQRGSAWRTGGVVGAAVVATGFGLLGALAASLCESNPCPSVGTGVLVGASIGAGVGFALGAGVGALIPRWRHRYP